MDLAFNNLQMLTCHKPINNQLEESERRSKAQKMSYPSGSLSYSFSLTQPFHHLS